MHVRVDLPADPQPAEVVQPRERALHDPPLTAHPRPILCAPAGYPVLEASPSELAAVLVVVIAAVGDHPLWSPAWPAPFARDRRDAVDQWQQLGDVIAVPAGQRDRQRHPAGIDVQMML